MTALQHYLEVTDLPLDETRLILDLAGTLKRERPYRRPQWFAGQCIALIFEGTSTRTRASFEVAFCESGGKASYIAPREFRHMRDTGLLDNLLALSRTVDVIAARIYDHDFMRDFARRSAVPVISGMTTLAHPCQALADCLTILERFGSLAGRKVACVGRGNVINSVFTLLAGLGADVRVVTHPDIRPAQRFLDAATAYAGSGGAVSVTHDLDDGVRGADVIYTDAWYDHNEMTSDEETAYWQRLSRAYQISPGVMALASPAAVFMHCMPSHIGEEVSREVFYSPQSIVIEQAEDRLHAQKALLLRLVRPRLFDAAAAELK